MTDLASLSVAALLILLGTIGIFLWIGGKSDNFELPDEVPENKRKLVGIGGAFFLVLGLMMGVIPLFELFTSGGESTPLPLPTSTVQIVEVEDIPTPLPATNSPESIIEPTLSETEGSLSSQPPDCVYSISSATHGSRLAGDRFHHR